MILDAPLSAIMLSKNTLSDDANWQLRRIGLDGVPLWQADTGLKIIQYVLTDRQARVISGLSVRGGNKTTARFAMTHVGTKTGRVFLRSLEKDN